MGYTFIDNIRELNVFMTTDSNAIELQTDFETKKLAQLKTYKISDILGYLLIACYWTFTLCELLRLIEGGASCFIHYCVGCDVTQLNVLHNVHRRISLG